MTYSTLMVHLELGRPNTRLLQIAAELSERFHAGVMGIAGRPPLQMAYASGYVSGDLVEQDRAETAREIKAAEGEFHGALQSRVGRLEWRSAQTYGDLSEFLVNESRSADLIVTGVASSDFFDESYALHVGDLIMRAGRPVLTVPAIDGTLRLDRVLVAWKDTRESRRAVADALPLLKQAVQVNVVEVAINDDLAAAGKRVQDVVVWLKCHDIKAEGTVHPSTGDDASVLFAIGQDMAADVFVAGAYGHSRLREWAFGGVTRNLLLHADRCSFVSH